MKICWLADIHVNAINHRRLLQFCEKIVETQSDCVVISGDISESKVLESHLQSLDFNINLPIYFVLGNHDFYGGLLANTRESALAASLQSPNLKWLPAFGPISLSEKTALIGQDSWYDARQGYEYSPVFVIDWMYIKDFRQLKDQEAKLELSRRMAAEEAEKAEQQLRTALLTHDLVICLTHFPPWPKLAYHGGKPANEYWLPYYTSEVMGQMFERVMYEHPTKRLMVLSGHTHSQCSGMIANNILAFVAGAKFGAPTIADVIYIDNK